MRYKTLFNVLELIDLIYPALAEWLHKGNYGYLLPSKLWLSSYTVEFIHQPILPGTTSTLGQHYAETKIIRIAIDRPLSEVMATVTHEYAHAVQFYNIRNEWRTLYSNETASRGYYDNKYEHEARRAGFLWRAMCVHYSYAQHNLASLAQLFVWRPTVEKTPHPEEFYWTTKPSFPDWEYKGFWRTYHNRRR